jgi:hypothetical protein
MRQARLASCRTGRGAFSACGKLPDQKEVRPGGEQNHPMKYRDGE